MLQRLRHAVGWGLPPPPAGTRVDFQVCAALGHGQMVYLVGNIPSLGGSIDSVPSPATSSNGGTTSGNSGNEAGVPLVTTPDVYPIWYNLEPIVVPVGTVIRYRYAICTGSKFSRYESISTQTREIVVGMEDLQTQDTLDTLDGPVGDVWGMCGQIPRLSSGQAFTDRRASGGSTDSNEARSSRRSSRRYNHSFTDPIPEESADVTMREAEEEAISLQASRDQFHRLSSAPASAPSFKPDEDPRHVCTSPITTRSRSYSDESAKSPQNVMIESTDGVIIVVYRLPVLVHRTDEGEYRIEWEDDNPVCPSGLLKDTNHNKNWDRVNTMRITWVGTVHCSSIIPKEDEERLAYQLAKFHCVPVYLNPSLAETFHGFCHGTLWPIFHNLVDVFGKLPTRWWNPTKQRLAWTSYKNVNRIFVNKVIEVYNEGDLVWVHGLHLLVTPSFLIRRLPYVNVGLFLHTPFPSSEIFRTLSVRADLLRGMLAADHIGFHLYEHARHFLTSCRRILGIKYSAQPGGYVGIEYSGRVVMLTISHIGIEPVFVDLVSRSDRVVQEARALREKYEANKHTIVVSVDRVERLKGLLLKLSAIEEFIVLYPEWLDKIQFIQVGIIDSSNPTEEKLELYKEMADAVKRVNDRFSEGRKEPLVAYWEVENTDLASRLPLWKVGDVMLTTIVRDAVNLYPFEFVYSHELSKKPGVVIVSEFSGSQRVLTGSIGINPWKREEIVRAIQASLTMPEEERTARHKKDLEYVINNSRTKWAERILVDLKRTKKSSGEGEYMGYGLGLGFRMLEFNPGFKLLDTEAVAKAYRSSFRRVLLFDYGNTLASEGIGKNDFSKYLNQNQSGVDLAGSDKSIVSTKEMPGASPELLSALSTLCADPRNTVFVLSGKERDDLMKTLGSVKGLGLAAEHGYLYKWGDGKLVEGEDVWLCTKDNFDDSWKDVTHSVMDIYTQRTNGTYIELKGSSMLWQYRDADPEFGGFQAKELHDHLTEVLEHFQVDIVTGTDYLEVRPQGVDKGVVIDRIMSTLESTNGGLVDFVLCVGDDTSDEFMFQYLEETRSRPKLFTVTVGKKPSAAKYFVNDVDQVLEILYSLTKLATASSRTLSLNDLRLLEQPYRANDLLSFRVNPPASMGSNEGGQLKTLGAFNRFDLHSNQSTPTSGSAAAAAAIPQSTGGMRSKYSMSMSALSSMAGLAPTSSTYEQYFENIDESGEEEQGGIFF